VLIDGSLDIDDRCRTEAPVIFATEDGRELGALPRSLARQFAEAILEIDNEVEGWVGELNDACDEATEMSDPEGTIQ
jgi:hypothetical protein